MKKSSLLFLAIMAMAMALGCEEPSLSPRQEESPAFPDKGATLAATSLTPIQIYGAWHAGNDACTWATERTVTEFDSKNHWLIDRGDGRPSVNLVVLSFVNPLKLLNRTTDAGNLNGVPRG